MKKYPDHIVTRFAPSPTGALHLGHLYAARFAREWADRHSGEMRLRIEDIDFTRCKAEFETMIFDDLDFMGIGYEGEVIIQSQRQRRYKDALKTLQAEGYVYPCHLTRRALNDLLSAPHAKNSIIRNTDQFTASPEDDAPAWRLRMDKIGEVIKSLTYTEWNAHTGRGESDGEEVAIDLDALDDVVIARKDIGTSYHLSVVLDDHDSGVSVVTRGEDLRASTPIHRLLQELLGLKETIWAHHRLINDKHGERLAKRDASESIQHHRQKGLSALEIMALIER